MALFVNTNVASLSGQKNLMDVTARMNSSFEKLSSGSRINSARDDAAGLQISDRLTTQITGLNQASRNANDGISIAQIAEGALGEITNNIQRMRQLAVQGGNRTLSDDDRSALGEEFSKLANVNNDIADRTAYGTLKILNYDANSAGFQVQSGAFSGEQDTVTTGNAKLASLFGQIAKNEIEAGTIAGGIDISLISAEALSALGTIGEITAAYMIQEGQSDVGVAIDAIFGADFAAQAGKLSTMGENSAFAVDVDELTKILTTTLTADHATADMSAVLTGTGSFVGVAAATAIDSDGGYSDAQLNTLHGFMTDTLLDAMSGLVTSVDKQRAKLGAEQNGLTSMVRNNTTAVVNVSDSRARIQDTDFAAETAELTRNQIIQQASTTILSQANQLPQTALSLLR
ncbi:flagellin [Oceanospirillum sanctuarii]|uniref:flagellin N-terminal helical domain-containing protein n=1 Tax=Oceanospirillum sanctuarii TaxID=1434821 RepID=UPI000A369E62|nr:flagellin [Oceanospirillum sanctuarii]